METTLKFVLCTLSGSPWRQHFTVNTIAVLEVRFEPNSRPAKTGRIGATKPNFENIIEKLGSESGTTASATESYLAGSAARPSDGRRSHDPRSHQAVPYIASKYKTHGCQRGQVSDCNGWIGSVPWQRKCACPRLSKQQIGTQVHMSKICIFPLGGAAPFGFLAYGK